MQLCSHVIVPCHYDTITQQGNALVDSFLEGQKLTSVKKLLVPISEKFVIRFGEILIHPLEFLDMTVKGLAGVVAWVGVSYIMTAFESKRFCV